MKRRHGGFSLVEVLVGLAIGLLAVIVVMQVFSVSEASKRTTTGGADATTSGASALYMVEREAKMAGWGLETSLYMGRTNADNPILSGCQTLNSYCSTIGCGTGDYFSLVPLSIQDSVGGNGADTITIRYFSDPAKGNFVPPSSGYVFSNKQDASNVPQLLVSSNAGCKKGDLVLVSESQGSTCTLIQVSDDPVATPGSLTLPHKSGSNPENAYNDPAWDSAAPTVPPVIPEMPNYLLATCFTPTNTGPTSRSVFSVDTDKGVLQKAGGDGVPEAIAEGIVDMQAQYGIAADGAQVVSSWVDATAGSGWDDPVLKAGASGSTTTNRLQNIKAVRIALLARSAQYEKPTSGSTCDATTGSPGTPGATGWSTWATFNTAAYPTGWDCYRYRAFEIVVPLRNVIWGNS